MTHPLRSITRAVLAVLAAGAGASVNSKEVNSLFIRVPGGLTVNGSPTGPGGPGGSDGSGPGSPEPKPEVKLSAPASFSFGQVPGTEITTKRVTFRADGSRGTLQFSGVPTLDAGPFSIHWGETECAGSLPAGTVCAVAVSLDSRIPGNYSSTLALKADGEAQPVRVALSGEVTNPLNLVQNLKLPATTQRKPLNVGLSQYFSVVGEAVPDASRVDWSVGPGLPPGVVLVPASASLSGNPSTPGDWNFDVTARYKGMSVTSKAGISVAPFSVASKAGAKAEDGVLGKAYSFDLSNMLEVTGTSWAPIEWSVKSGSLPKGLTMTTAGNLQGTPTEISTQAQNTFEVELKVEGQTVFTFSAAVATAAPTVIAKAGVREWSNGTYAESCEAYIRPAAPYLYQGDIGSGVYNLKPKGVGAATPAYCDMTSDGGGWTLVFNSGRNSVVTGAFRDGNNLAVATSPENGQSSGSVGVSRWFDAFPFKMARIVAVAGDDQNVRLNYYKTLTVANVKTWSDVTPELDPTMVCTNLAMTTKCTPEGFAPIGGMVALYGVHLGKYGYQTTGDPNWDHPLPFHGMFEGAVAGFCSVTADYNSNSWPDSFGDGHWGNGLMVWFR